VALSARSALTKLHTPVPCMVSVAPTAYRAPSNAVLMDQKMGAISTGVGAFGRSCRAREMWRIAMTCRLRTRKRPAHIARGFLAPIGDFFFLAREQSRISRNICVNRRPVCTSHRPSSRASLLAPNARARQRHVHQSSSNRPFTATPRLPRRSTARRWGCRCARTPSRTW
jgi:hypothetical protein